MAGISFVFYSCLLYLQVQAINCNESTATKRGKLCVKSRVLSVRFKPAPMSFEASVLLTAQFCFCPRDLIQNKGSSLWPMGCLGVWFGFSFILWKQQILLLTGMKVTTEGLFSGVMILPASSGLVSSLLVICPSAQKSEWKASKACSGWWANNGHLTLAAQSRTSGLKKLKRKEYTLNTI